MQNISAGAIGGRTMYSAVKKTRRQVILIANTKVKRN
jgi:hypothetical protein